MLRLVYDLRTDRDHVAAVQDATINSSWAGLVPSNGLFGSDEWWANIASGLIATHVMVGRITRVFMSGHNDYPEFEMESAGAKQSWTRRGEDELYAVGREARVEYVEQQPKSRIPGLPYPDRVVLRMFVDDGGT